MRRCLTRWDENVGEKASGFREGANSSQARRFAKKAANFEPGTVCGGLAAQDFRERQHGPRGPNAEPWDSGGSQPALMALPFGVRLLERRQIGSEKPAYRRMAAPFSEPCVTRPQRDTVPEIASMSPQTADRTRTHPQPPQTRPSRTDACTAGFAAAIAPRRASRPLCRRNPRATSSSCGKPPSTGWCWRSPLSTG